MKKLLGLLLLSTAAFGEVSSVERPNMYPGKDAQSHLLETIDYRLSNIHNDLAILRATFIECQRSNEILTVLNDNLISLIQEQQNMTKSIDYLNWQQDHKLAETKPPKKGP
jgi:hypothetical protein